MNECVGRNVDVSVSRVRLGYGLDWVWVGLGRVIVITFSGLCRVLRKAEMIVGSGCARVLEKKYALDDVVFLLSYI